MRSNTMKSINDIKRDGKKQADPIRKERLAVKARDIDARNKQAIIIYVWKYKLVSKR